MIVFDLKCGAGHVFEAWFASSAAYEDQRSRDIITCPHCGATDITKAPMAPNIATSREDASASAADDDADMGPAPAVAPALAQEARALFEALRTKVESEFDYVGRGFAEEARKIHYGEADARPIYGEASPEEARALQDEGVDVLPLPVMPRHDA